MKMNLVTLHRFAPVLALLAIWALALLPFWLNTRPAHATIASVVATPDTTGITGQVSQYTISWTTDQNYAVGFQAIIAFPAGVIVPAATVTAANTQAGFGTGTTAAAARAAAVASLAGANIASVAVAGQVVTVTTAVINPPAPNADGVAGNADDIVAIAVRFLLNAGITNPPTDGNTDIITVYTDQGNEAVGYGYTGSPVASPDIAYANRLISDRFNRANMDRCSLAQADNTLGGSGTHYYLPIFGGPSNPIGANIDSNTLRNNGLDYGGVQFTSLSGACYYLNYRGENVGQDINIRVDLLVPSDASNHITQAGPYLRSRFAAAGDGIIGGDYFDPSGGYWIQLHSTGEVKVKNLRTGAIAAFSGIPSSFNNTVFHALEIAAQGNNLQVTLDGKLLTFNQGGTLVTTVSIPNTDLTGDTNPGQDGTAGIAFGAEPNRGMIGSQRADNLLVTAHSSLAALPVQNNFAAITVQGSVTLEGRTDHGGAKLTFSGQPPVFTGTDGSFQIQLSVGTYAVTAEKVGYLTATKTGLAVTQGMSPLVVKLLGGDNNGDGVIDLIDLSLLAKNLGKTQSPWP